jgi:tetratricopeptide (TPR) repeat protein
MANLKRRDNSKFQKKAKSIGMEEQSRASRRSWRPVGLLTLLACLLVTFFWTGGATGFANSMAKSAISSKRLEAGEWWLGVSKFFSSTDAYSDFLQGRIDRKRGDYETMVEHLKSALKKGFPPIKLDREQALATASLGRLTPDVEERLVHWLDEPDADYSEIVDSYANGLTAVSRFDDALELLQTWQSTDPLDPVANYRIARIHEHLSQPEDAEANYRKAIAKDPRYFKASYNLGRVLLDQRRSDEALTCFQKSANGGSALAAKTGMAQCYKTLGENEVARGLLQEVMKSSYKDLQKSYQAVDETPARYVAASELGCLETELGDFAEARKHLELALKEFPLDSIARYSYAVTLRGLGMQKEADENFAITRASRAALDQVAVFQGKLRKDSQDTESRIAVGKIILENESERAGLFWLQSVFSYDPNNSDAHEAIASYFENKKVRTPEDEKRAEYHRAFVQKK